MSQHQAGINRQMVMNNRQMDMNNRQMDMNKMYQMNKAYTYAVPWAYNYGYQQAPRFFKREAEAEADPAYWYGNVYNRFGSRWGYSGFYNRPYGYNWGYNGYRRYGGYWW